MKNNLKLREVLDKLGITSENDKEFIVKVGVFGSQIEYTRKHLESLQMNSMLDTEVARIASGIDSHCKSCYLFILKEDR